MTSIEDFAEDLYTELRYDADLDGSEAMLSEVFTRRMIETLIEAGEVEEADDCFHQNDSVRPAVEVSGYGITDDTLSLLTTIHLGLPTERVSRSDIARQLRRARAFWERCRDRPYHDDLEESSDAWDMALRIHRAAPQIRRVQIFCLTDGFTQAEYPEPFVEQGVEYRQSTWDLTRLWRLAATGREAEPVEVDFVERFGMALPVLPAGESEEYRAFMAVIPGHWLADVYDEFGHRLLERNVRSFLQFSGSTNKGIRDTIRDQPTRFLAYNNGISATAAEVRLAPLPSGGAGIAWVRDLQIVNGGQTTASVHRCMKDKVDVSKISVQAKLSVVDGPLLDELVPDISKFANTQNKVQQADLSSNDPFHIRVQQLSATVWAPPTAATPRQTKWFYERARGQYQDALKREETPAQKRRFKDMHPTRQKMTKVELATFENTFAMRPHEVSKGAQKNFGDFMTQLADRGPDWMPDAAWWQRAVAKGIIFRDAERIVGAQNFGGYRRNIVAYALARLVDATQGRLDLKRVFDEQKNPPQIAEAIERLAYDAYEVLTWSERPSQNVTEWAKKPACWARMRERDVVVSPPLQEWLLAEAPDFDSGTGSPRHGSRRSTKETDEQRALIDSLMAGGPEPWVALGNWAKQTKSLHFSDRGIAGNLARRIEAGHRLTVKEAEHATRIRAEAAALGFDASATENGSDLVSRTVAVGAVGWQSLVDWAKRGRHLEPWERGVAAGIAEALRAGRTPSTKQVAHAIRMLDEAERLGWEPHPGGDFDRFSAVARA